MEVEDDRAGKLRELFGYHVGATMEGGMLGARLRRRLGPKSEVIFAISTGICQFWLVKFAGFLPGLPG